MKKVESKICPIMLRNIIGQLSTQKMCFFFFFLSFFNRILPAERRIFWINKKGTFGQMAIFGQIFDSTAYIYIYTYIHIFFIFFHGIRPVWCLHVRRKS